MKKQTVAYSALAVFLVLQLLPSGRPAIHPASPGLDLLAVERPPARVGQLLRDACYDCHSNATRYPWYAHVQPVGWYVQRHVDEGRTELNFSEFGRWRPAERRELLDHCASLLEKRRMPLTSYARLHRAARLSDDDRRVLADWLRNPRPAADLPRDTCDDPDMSVFCCFRDAPDAVNPTLRLADAGGTGEPLTLHGRVVRAGTGAAYAGVRLYVYHTDAHGRYTPDPGATGAARWHGRWHGWLRTDADGRFTIYTIRPAQYPQPGAPPAHIHVAVWPPDQPRPFWITDFKFSGTPEKNDGSPDNQLRRSTGWVKLTRKDHGWLGERVIRLE